METQTWLSRHYKFISAENITILSVSSDDFLHAFLEVAEQPMWNYSSYLKNNDKKIKNKNKNENTNTNYLNSQAWAEGIKIRGSINICIYIYISGMQ